MQVAIVSKVMVWPRRLTVLAFAAIILASAPRLVTAQQQLPPDTTPAQAAQKTPAELQQLVAPIALYPDALVAQILAAATFPTQVVQADRWLQQRPNLRGEELASAVDEQSWDPSVKALTAFPAELANLDKNLSWTEALGDAYFNQQQNVLDAVQVMRRRAEGAGNLQSTAQERVVRDGPAVVIEPAYPDVAYVPSYNPWTAYGAPLAVYPGYSHDARVGPSFTSFGSAIGLGSSGRFGWGWRAWGFNWGRRVVLFNHHPFVSRSRFFFHRRPFSGAHGAIVPRRGLPPARLDRGFNNRNLATMARFGNGWASRGRVWSRAGMGPRPGAFNGVRPGGINRGSVSRGGPTAGRPSFQGGGRSFGGGARGVGSRGGGGGGRHR